MHPLLARPARLGIYLLARTPLAGLLAVLLATSGQFGWKDSIALAAPLCLVYAFVCLPAWYVCRVTPLAGEGVARLLSTHLLAACFASALWVGMARMLAGLLALAPGRFATQAPLLFGLGVLLYLLAVAFHYVLLALEASREAERREAEARVLAGESELRALKAQINPHFLYNSLNSISALTSLDAAKAREMCILLSEFLRSTLGLGERATITLGEELELVRRYLAIEKVRFGARLRVEEEIGEGCAAEMVPPLVLQPLVENAVVHGIAHVVENGVIRLSARYAEAGKLALTVENTFDPEAPRARPNGLGLANVKKRLYVRYGNQASLEAGPEGERFHVEMSLPAGKDREG